MVPTHMAGRPTFQISLYLTNRSVLLAGDGAIADDRAERLQAAGAQLTRVSAVDYAAADCAGKFLVVAADEDDSFNARVAADALAAGCLRYAHDQPDVSDFASPALIRRGPLTIAVSTQGTAPALSRVMRERLEALLASGGDELDGLIAELQRLRDSLPRGQRGPQLYRMASRLVLDGGLRVVDEDS